MGLPRLAALVGPAVLILGLAGCGSDVLVDAYPAEPGSDVDCAALLADLPAEVAGLETRAVSDGVEAAAWGDPPVVLRCGVGRPEAFEATSRCDTVEDVDWFSEPTADGVLFTTVGRRVDVSVDVPSVHDPAGDVLIDLAPAITRHAPSEQPCVG